MRFASRPVCLPATLVADARARVASYGLMLGAVLGGGLGVVPVLAVGARPQKMSQPPAHLLLWQGVDAQSSNSKPGGWGWSGPNSGVNLLEVSDKERHEGQTTLHWHGEGSGRLSANWNFADPTPAGATSQAAPLQVAPTSKGFDTRPYHQLTFWLKMRFQPGQAPGLLGVSLGGENQRLSPTVDLAAALKTASDQEWHLIQMPLSLFSRQHPPVAGRTLESPSLRFDPGAVNQIQFNCWSSVQSHFDLFVGVVATDMGTPAKSGAQQVKHS